MIEISPERYDVLIRSLNAMGAEYNISVSNNDLNNTGCRFRTGWASWIEDNLDNTLAFAFKLTDLTRILKSLNKLDIVVDWSYPHDEDYKAWKQNGYLASQMVICTKLLTNYDIDKLIAFLQKSREGRV